LSGVDNKNQGGKPLSGGFDAQFIEQHPVSRAGFALDITLCFTMSEMNDLQELWLKYNEYSNKLAQALGRTSNIVGEYAEHLAHRHYGGKLLEVSGASADIEAPDGTKYQVKSRRVKGTPTTQLNVIRSWEFDYLVVILFDARGYVKKALQVPVAVAKELAAPNSHQNGWVITTTQGFLSDPRSKDITSFLSAHER
jgi:hypothetical protein